MCYYDFVAFAPVAELAASNTSAAGGRYSECEKVQRSKSKILGTANGLAGAADNIAVEKNRNYNSAPVAELADAHGSGPCAGNGLGVQISSGAPRRNKLRLFRFFVQKISHLLHCSYFFCKRFRSSRLFACKRAHNAFISIATLYEFCNCYIHKW